MNLNQRLCCGPQEQHTLVFLFFSFSTSLVSIDRLHMTHSKYPWCIVPSIFHLMASSWAIMHRLTEKYKKLLFYAIKHRSPWLFSSELLNKILMCCHRVIMLKAKAVLTQDPFSLFLTGCHNIPICIFEHSRCRSFAAREADGNGFS